MKRLTVIIFILSTFQLFAQSDNKVKTILDKVSEKTKSYPSITATFDFIMQNDDAGLNEKSSGTLILQKDKYKLTFNGVEIYSDGKIQWMYIRDAEEVNITDANSGDEETINPATIFTIYENGFKNTYLGEFTNGSIKTYKIELIPVDIKEFTRIIIEINQQNYQIVSAKMFGKNDNIYNIIVKSMDTSKSYDASTFTFDTKKNPNVEVVDMR